MESTLFSILALILVMTLTKRCVHIAGENERFAISVAGKFERLIGPGICLRNPFGMVQITRLYLGDIGAYSGAKYG